MYFFKPNFSGLQFHLGTPKPTPLGTQRGKPSPPRKKNSWAVGKLSIFKFITKRVNDLLQNAAAFFYYKTRQKFITKHVRWFITKWADFITKRGRYYKMSRFYYKTRQVLQNAPFITKRGSTHVIFKTTSKILKLGRYGLIWLPYHKTHQHIENVQRKDNQTDQTVLKNIVTREDWSN